MVVRPDVEVLLDTHNVCLLSDVTEELGKVNPALVARDADGKAYTVRYDAVNATLLNEFLKARRQIDAQHKQIKALTTGLQGSESKSRGASPHAASGSEQAVNAHWKA